MRFFRHGGIYRSDVSFLLINLGPRPASQSGPGQAIRRAGRNTPCPSSAMSSAGYSSIGLLASITRLRFTGLRRLTCTPHKPGEKGTFLFCLDRPDQAR